MELASDFVGITMRMPPVQLQEYGVSLATEKKVSRSDSYPVRTGM